MKNIWRIFTGDIKNVGKNWVAAIIIGGLIALPSLYAWFNIEASWDPYSQTDQIPVGVVNEDSGADVRGEEIHVGDELIVTLEENDSFDWHFVDYDEAMEKVEYGDFFSVIVIPENFSESLATVVQANPEKATVEYFVNEKINAIAPKITEKGASVIVDQISNNFVSTVNGVIFDMFNEIGLEIEQELPDIQQFESYIYKLEENLPKVKEILDDSLIDANDAQGIISKAEKLIPDAETATNDGINIINETTVFLNDAEKRLNEMKPEIDKNLENVQKVTTEINDFMKEIDLTKIDFDFKEDFKQHVDERIDKTIETIETLENGLTLLEDYSGSNDEVIADEPKEEQENDEVAGDPEGNPSDGESREVTEDNEIEIKDLLSKLDELKKNILEIDEAIDQVDVLLTEQEGEAEEFINNLQSKTAAVSERVDDFIIEYNENIQPKVLAEIDKAKATLADASGILIDINSTIPEVERLLSNTGSSLDDGEELLENIMAEFPYVNTKVNELADRVRKIKDETDLNEVIELLLNDPQAERDFFAEPVKLNENRIFPIENYGSGMTPFYTVLAIWVGAVLLISLLSVDYLGDDQFSSRQVYFGRYLTFVLIGLLQTLIVTIGDITLIGVTVSSDFWFVVFGLFISIVFMSIVYTIVSVFGDVGKAIVIVMLVLQIAGSGGTYPVVLLPKFFQVISPMLPFTYAIDLMREALGGIVWARAIKDVVVLSSFGVGFILIGVFLKKAINKHTYKLMKKSKESGLFH